MKSAADAARGRLRAVEIGLWQAAATTLLVAVSLATARGSPLAILGGAALLYLSLILQHLAVRMTLRAGPRPGLAAGFFLLKLLLLLAVAAIGLRTTLLAPMSFAAGASTLLLAIVLDACYGNRSASRPR